MKIKIKRLVQPYFGADLELKEIEGILYEYNDLQFCICSIDHSWMAIELSTGYSSAFYESKRSDKHCIAEIKKGLESHSKEEYKTQIEQKSYSLHIAGFKLPINQKIEHENN